MASLSDTKPIDGSKIENLAATESSMTDGTTV